MYGQAKRLGLTGFVLNSSSGVTIEVEGPQTALNEFLDRLQREPPPLATIEQISTAELEIPGGEQAFEIRESLAIEGEFALVSPDVGTCNDCWTDVTDPDNRRFAYPFTNCTNCGPRYTIIRDIPYDRPFTTMAGFRMCRECEREYHDPTNRRFHAQPNACPACGPTLALSKIGSFLPGESSYGYGNLSLPILRDVRQLLRNGQIVAIKGMGGFHLACDAENSAAVERLRARKKRSDKPFALMARDLEAVEQFAEITAADRELLCSARRPIVILKRRPGTRIAASATPGNDTVGVMLPYTPLHLFLFGEDPSQPPEFTTLVMTSGNISDEPIITRNEEAWTNLAPVADWSLTHNRHIYMRVDDSVARNFAGKARVLRRSRGYAPQAIDLGRPVCELLACGAELKNTLCLTKDRYAVLSQHIGDVENFETLQFYEETLNQLKKLFRIEPQAVAHDMHPLYLTSRFARELGLPTLPVQHHHGHIASCMAENRLSGKVIGVAFDGTGYGTDGQIWGGEFLVADYAGFERTAHFRYVPLPGGDVAVRQAWRPAVSWLRDSFGRELPEIPLFERIPEKQLRIVKQMLECGVNTVQTSSCGRLFDAVSAMLGIRTEATFEGQAAIELEVAAAPGIEDGYPFEVSNSEPAEIDMRPAIRAIVRDLLASVSIGLIASRFHNTIAAVTADVCRRVSRSTGLRKVCLSGGTFQNWYLLDRTVRLLRDTGLETFVHSEVPPNDGGIALGQAVVAAAILQRGA